MYPRLTSRKSKYDLSKARNTGRVGVNLPQTPLDSAAAKCERIYREQTSGGRWERPEPQRLLNQLRKGDVLVV